MKTIITEIHCDSQLETEALAARMATLAKPGDLFALTGDLGAGKSTFSRAFIRAVMGNPQAEVPSPTFTLVQEYDALDYMLYHADLYRLQEPDEVYDLGLDDERAEAVMLIEWPDRLPEEWWDGATEISLARAEKHTPNSNDIVDEARLVTIKSDGNRFTKLKEIS